MPSLWVQWKSCALIIHIHSEMSWMVDEVGFVENKIYNTNAYFSWHQYYFCDIHDFHNIYTNIYYTHIHPLHPMTWLFLTFPDISSHHITWHYISIHLFIYMSCHYITINTCFVSLIKLFCIVSMGLYVVLLFFCLLVVFWLVVWDGRFSPKEVPLGDDLRPLAIDRVTDFSPWIKILIAPPLKNLRGSYMVFSLLCW